jgi:hypothetical protein
MSVPTNGVEYNTNVVNWSGLSATTLFHLAFAFSATVFLSDTTRTEAQVQHEIYNYINLIVKIGNRAECLSRQLKSESGGGEAASELGVVEIICEEHLQASDSTGVVEFVAWKDGRILFLVEAKNAVRDPKSVVGQLFAETKGGRAALNESDEFISVIIDGSGNMDFFEQRLSSSSEIHDGYTEDFKLVGLGRGQLFFRAKETMSTMTSLKY